MSKSSNNKYVEDSPNGVIIDLSKVYLNKGEIIIYDTYDSKQPKNNNTRKNNKRSNNNNTKKDIV
ncbi:MAG: hypothetical protein PF488_00520 [Patescibacteria group bacterium]|jgi:hypothetical protein|nr:hypothetical protein [Patescibacteria group bacterium]